MAKKATTSQSTTQAFLEVFDITNNLVIMKNGMVSVALTVSAINFGLLAEEEQDAVMYAYAGLLNSINYPIQIVIHSQTKDVTKYLSLLKEQEESASSTIIRKRIGVYREFVANLIQERNVLDKKFFVVIPATALELGFVSPKGLLPGQGEVDISTYERSVIVEKAKNILEPRRDHLIAQFARIGLYARELETQEIIQLFYVRYNPEAIEGQQIEESSSYTAPLVTAQIRESLYNQLSTASSDLSPAAPSTPTQSSSNTVATTFEETPLLSPFPSNQTPLSAGVATAETPFIEALPPPIETTTQMEPLPALEESAPTQNIAVVESQDTIDQALATEAPPIQVTTAIDVVEQLPPTSISEPEIVPPQEVVDQLIAEQPLPPLAQL